MKILSTRMLSLVAIAAAATSCGLGDASESGASVGEVSLATQVDVPEGTDLVIAEQNASESLPWNLSGAGENVPYKVEFADFSGGAAVIEALRSGAADIGAIGEAPVPIAVNSGVTDIVTVAIEANPGSSGGYYLVAQPGSGIDGVDDLRGKRVAYPPGSGRHMITAALLKRAGLDLQKDTRPVELAGAEVVPTFAAGAVDAAIVLGNQYYKLGKPPIIGDGTGINTGIESLIVRRDTLDDPAKVAAIGDYIGRTVAAGNWCDAHPEEWINGYYVDTQGLEYDDGKELLDTVGTGAFYPIDPASTRLFQQVADGLLDTGTIGKPVDISGYVDGRYNDIVAKQNTLDGVTPKQIEN
ncbi:PhnD/SsuA/transferrin family substrate-binding protein [Nocardia jinanensis]|uniref:Sulfonate ABC transporter periplasmic sulfonate-binding protein SsuA n=1 Tax=Nocardia jinanensis TaxID=382504 RepID=A0A917RDI6_9NOCA|nr:PhnD/SsuA/transferrin family substrate-binding protein [Nocardia jinanensis]GGL03011.1 sulfonate ABC transporter periplasmic sulfonate-binding protein SsuA [Nocardia jinanensis]